MRDSETARPARGRLARYLLGGALMGLANLVPGVSGGTMLLATGIYTRFIEAIARLTTLRFRRADLILLSCVIGAAVVAILSLAGPTRDAVIGHPSVMYSLFIGLTLGGVPLIWRLARPGSPVLFGAAALSFSLMVWMAVSEAAAPGGTSSLSLLFLAGLAGASAMILPGVSGGYLLLLLGQYVAILSALDDLKLGLTELQTRGLDGLYAPLAVLVPVAIGVGVGVIAVSNLLRFALRNHLQATLGLLLGLLLGAVAGLWPFRTVEESAAGHDPEDVVLVRYAPSAGEAAGSLALVLLGFALTQGIDRLGGDGKLGESSDS